MNTRHLFVCAVAAAISFNLSGCGNDNDSVDPTAECVHAAIQTYPTWPETNPPVLETIQECKGLPVADRNAIRDEMATFVSATNARIAKE